MEEYDAGFTTRDENATPSLDVHGIVSTDVDTAWEHGRESCAGGMARMPVFCLARDRERGVVSPRLTDTLCDFEPPSGFPTSGARRRPKSPPPTQSSPLGRYTDSHSAQRGFRYGLLPLQLAGILG